jgi:hypothetical protein
MARLAFLGTNGTAVLQPYKPQRAPLHRFLRHGAFLSMCILLGLMNGFLWVLLPPQLFLVFALPLAVLLLLVIWALPDVEHAPTRWVARLFLIYLGVTMLWPSYLAFQVSGLPLISIQRLAVVPLALLFVICYSISAAFRTDLKNVFDDSKWPLRLVAAFTLVQLLTIFWAQNVPYAISFTLKFWMQYTVCFFVAAWLAMSAGRDRSIVRLLVGAALILSVIASLEWFNHGVLWINHIPSFLQVEQEGLFQRFVEGAMRDGRYRAVGTYSVSLSLAEVLALSTPFIIHQMMKAKSIWIIALWGLADLLLLWGIETTQSRLGTLGWVVAHAVYGCLWAFRRWRRQRTDIVAPAVSLMYPIATLVFFVGMFTIPAIRNRTIGGGSTGASDQSRLEQFAQMWPKLKANPFGYGGGSSGTVLQYYDPGGLLTVDSYVITLLLDMGVIGFLLFAGLLIYLAVKMIQVAWSATDKHEVDLALPLACAFLVMIEVRLVLSQFDNHALLFALMGLGAALLSRARRNGVQV